MSNPVSNCCGAEMRVASSGGTTQWHVCGWCGLACDVKADSGELMVDRKKAVLDAVFTPLDKYPYPAPILPALAIGLTLLLASTNCSFAQRGTGANPAAITAAPAQTSFAPALSAVAPPAHKTNLFYNLGLVWDASPDAGTTGFRIRYGTNTGSAFFTNTLTLAGTNTFCTVSNLAFKPTWYFQVFALSGTTVSEGSNILPVQPPIETGFVLSTVFPLYTSTNAVNWITNKVVVLSVTNPPANSFFRSHFRQLDYQWTNNQIRLKPFSIP